MKVLIIHPEFKDPGGVSNYFIAIKDNFHIEATHFIIGKRIAERTISAKFIRFLLDYIRFLFLLRKENFDLVHINPSLNFKGVVRDGIFILLSRLYKKKVIVFFHGWEKDFEKKLKSISLKIFRIIYKKADAYVVLSSEFKKKLGEWGFNKHIYIETTAIEDNMVRNLDINKVIEKRRNGGKYKILFLARIIKEKGIYETVDAFKHLQEKYPSHELVIAGDGEELDNIKSYVRQNGITSVTFTGYVRGEVKKSIFENSSVYCLPTYEEGMPCSVVEAISFGLPVITRPVGGIIDLLKDGENGFITTSKEPSVISSYIERLCFDEKLYEKISRYNYIYAQEKFLASNVARRLEKIYEEVFQYS